MLEELSMLLSKEEIDKLGGIEEKEISSKKGKVKVNYVKNYAINTIPEEDGGYSYMCPRFWCFSENRPLTIEELEDGECGGIEKLAPLRSSNGKLIKEMPTNKNIFEFTDNTYHKYQGNPFAEKDSEEYKKWRNNYIQYYPGILKKNNKNKEPPCCVIKDVFIKQKLKDKKVKKNVYESSYAPMKKLGLIKEGSTGYLPESLQYFLKYSNEQCYSKIDGSRGKELKKEKWCLLRLGILSNNKEDKENSFLKCIANLIDESDNITNLKEYMNNKSQKRKEFYNQIDIVKNKIKEISLLSFLIANKGNLYEIFSDKIYDRNSNAAMILQYHYREKKNWKRFNKKDKDFIKHLKRRGKKIEIIKIIKARRNFINYIINGKNINYEYLWDLICLPKKEGVYFLIKV